MSPLCIFVYKRYDTTKQLLESLLGCPECANSELYVFMDGARNDAETNDVEKTRELFDNLQGFKSIHLYPAKANKGLAQSVIDGVTTVLDGHDTVIVLEDDLVVAHDFLAFMDAALETYKDRDDIWSISGYTPQLRELELENTQGVFLSPRAQCWGWATWKDRWKTVDWQVSDFNTLVHSKERRDAFNMGGNDLFRTLKMERRGRIESWAVRWTYAASRQNKWTVNPVQSKVRNIGLDSSASHTGWHDKRHDVELHGNTTVIDPEVRPNNTLVQAFKRHHDLSLISRIGYFMRLHNLGYNFIKRLIKRL